jgi:hypothetical protein
MLSTGLHFASESTIRLFSGGHLRLVFRLAEYGGFRHRNGPRERHVG